MPPLPATIESAEATALRPILKDAVFLFTLPAVLFCAGTVRPAIADQDLSDQAMLQRLLEQDARLSRLIQRDPKLLQVLESDPEMVRKMANWGPLHVRIWRALANPWVVFGFAAQSLYLVRFLIQWIASERKQRSYVPVVFWYFSIGGGLMTLTYAMYRRDPVFMVGQSLGLVIYLRNLVLIYRRKWAYQELLADRAAARADGELLQAGVAAATATDPSGAA